MSSAEMSRGSAGSNYPHKIDDTLVPKVLSVGKSVRQIFSIYLAHIDVMPGQDQFLLALDEETPQSTGHISNKLSVRPSTVSKMVDILARKGWITRSISKKDGRVTHLLLTQEGVAVREQVKAVWKQFEAELTRTVGENELRALQALDALLMKRLRRLR